MNNIVDFNMYTFSKNLCITVDCFRASNFITCLLSLMHISSTSYKYTIKQGWLNCSSRAACGSSNLCMRLYDLSKNYIIVLYFLFLLQSAKIF